MSLWGTRPERDETIEYYQKYIALVPDGDIRETLGKQRDDTMRFLAAIPESRASHRYEPGKWTVLQTLCHMNDAERLFTMRAFWFGRGFTSELPSFESDDAVIAAKADAVLLVLDCQETRKRSLRKAVRDLEAVGADVLGTVVNKAPKAETGRCGY